MDLYRLFFSLFLLALRAHAFALPAPVVTNGSTAAIECKKHTVHNGDTCLGITRANNITYAQILAWNNNLRPACT
jgi:LysM repeat protein